MTTSTTTSQGEGAAINGFLNLYKTSGPTSMDVVRRIKRITGQRKKVGHGGTLDPLAEGVLPICFGQATKLMELLVEGDKEYKMEVHLGVATTTYDGEGEPTRTSDPAGVTLAQVEEALGAFQGVIDQTPPMYSAIKWQGKRLYKLARAGVEVEREPRKVEIRCIEVLDFSLPSLLLRVDSGRGAYMRSVAHDLGDALGCGGYLKNLVRLRSGAFGVEETVTISSLQETEDPGAWREHLLPVDYVLLQMKAVAVSPAAERLLRRGQSIALPAHLGSDAGYMERFRAYTRDGRLLGVVRYDKGRNQWRPDRLFNLDVPSPNAPKADVGV